MLPKGTLDYMAPELLAMKKQEQAECLRGMGRCEVGGKKRQPGRVAAKECVESMEQEQPAARS